jgi:hypothetical protein
LERGRKTNAKFPTDFKEDAKYLKFSPAYFELIPPLPPRLFEISGNTYIFHSRTV